MQRSRTPAPTFHSQAHSPLPNSSAKLISFYRFVPQSFTSATKPTRESIDIYHEESNKMNGPAQTGPATSKYTLVKGYLLGFYPTGPLRY